MIDRPQGNVKYEEIVNIWDEKPETWKQELVTRLRSVAHHRPLTKVEFESYLIRNKPIFEDIARQYHVTIEDIHLWLDQTAQKEGLVSSEWQAKEKLHIEDLIVQQQRKQQKWTIDELKLRLNNDQRHLQDAVVQYHVTIEELKAWYTDELNRLLEQRRISPSLGLSWQTIELDHIYQTVIHNPTIGRQALEQLIFTDGHARAARYGITVEELRVFIQEQLRRFGNLGFYVDTGRQASNWRDQERKRLREVATGVVITEQELLEFISQDTAFQTQLAQLYQVGLVQLAPVQRIFIGNMVREQLLEVRRLNNLTSWQQRERDRLYEFIGTQNMTQAQLRSWQSQDGQLLQGFAQKYDISVQQLKEWQKQELERINQVARNYGMTQSDLQQFREGELRHLAYVNHRQLMGAAEAQNWEKRHQWTLGRLQSRYGKFGQELVAWRRILFLLSQGLIDLPSGGRSDGGYVVDTGTTNATAQYKPIFSKDRGDQPPHTYEENYDEGDEPGLEGETRSPPYPRPQPPRPSPIMSTPTPPLPYSRSGPSGGYEYRRRDYTINVPVGTASASASGGPTGSSASASATLGKWSRSSGDEPSQQVEDLGQQQQEELGWNANLEDLGQQQQVVDSDWDQQQQSEDLGQQQVQVEDLSADHFGRTPAQASTRGQLQQQPAKVSIRLGQNKAQTKWFIYPTAGGGGSHRGALVLGEAEGKTRLERKPICQNCQMPTGSSSTELK